MNYERTQKSYYMTKQTAEFRREMLASALFIVCIGLLVFIRIII